MKPASVVIKKYGNRRLYDTAASRYVNLDDIAGMVRNGTDVQVVDARTGEDLTRVTLTQIITEDAKGKPSGLPLELLRQLVLAGDRASQEFIMWYLKSAFDTYQKLQDTMHDRMSDVQSAVLSPIDTVKRFLGRPSAPAPAEQESEVEALRRRIAELESRVEKPRAARKRTRTRKT